jgi:hypothetical protein
MAKKIKADGVGCGSEASCPEESPGKMRGCRRVALATLACSLIAQSSPADPVRDPKRLINNFTIDLTPLCKWWQKKDGPRPLSAWAHLTGSVVGTNSGAWIIEGKPDGLENNKTARDEGSAAASSTEQARFLLLNPPVEQLSEFQRLVDRLAELNRRKAELVSQAAEAHSRDEAVAEQERVLRGNRAQARVLATEDKQLKSLENQAKTDQKSLDQEIKDLKSKLAAYPKLDQYVLDCFALDLHSEHQQMPVYDYGRSWK